MTPTEVHLKLLIKTGKEFATMTAHEQAKHMLGVAKEYLAEAWGNPHSNCPTAVREAIARVLSHYLEEEVEAWEAAGNPNGHIAESLLVLKDFSRRNATCHTK